MAYRPRKQTFRRRTRRFTAPFRRTRRRTTRRRPSAIKKYLMYALIAGIVILIIKNKQKVTDFFKSLTGKK